MNFIKDWANVCKTCTCDGRLKAERVLFVHVPNSGGGGGGRVGGLRHPLDFQSKIKNFCHPTLLKIRFKITVTLSKNGQSQNYGALTL